MAVSGLARAYGAGGEPPGAAALLHELAGAYQFDLLSGIPFAAHMRDKGRNPAEWTDQICSELLNMSVAETSGIIVTELAAYLDSWQGSEQDKWSGCYVALRDRVRRRLEPGRAKPLASTARAEGVCEERHDN